MLLPNTIYNNIAVNLRGVNSNDEIEQLIGAKTKDPVTGLMRGEKPPALNAAQPESNEVPEEDKEILYYMEANGIDPTSKCGETILAALKKKGKGKC